MRSAQPSHDRGAICPFPAGTTDCEPCVTPAKPRQHRCARRHRLESQWTLTPPQEPRPLKRPRNGGRTPRSSRTGMSGVGWLACSTRAVQDRARRRWSAAKTPRPFVSGSSAPRSPADQSPARAGWRLPVLACPQMAPYGDLETVAPPNGVQESWEGTKNVCIVLERTSDHEETARP